MSLGQIRIAQNRMEVSLTVTDASTIAYVERQPEEARLAAFTRCYLFGSRVIQYANDRKTSSEICEQIDASAESAKRLLTNISSHTQNTIDRSMQTVFGKDGLLQKSVSGELTALRRELEKTLDPDQASSFTARIRTAIDEVLTMRLCEIQKSVDLNNPDGIFGHLKADLDAKHKVLDDKINGLVTQAAVRDGVGIERLRGTAKGADFEDFLEIAIGNLCRPRHDRLERTSNTMGLSGRSKCGDFIIEVNPAEAGGTGLRIVVEAKNDQMRQRDLIRELDEAMENRGARFAVGISTNPAVLPKGSPPIYFVEDNKIIVQVADFDALTSTMDPIFIEVALEVARAMAIANREAKVKPMDLASMEAHVSNAMNMTQRLSEAKKRFTSIVKIAQEGDGIIDQVRDDVRGSLQAIRDAITQELASAEIAA